MRKDKKKREMAIQKEKLIKLHTAPPTQKLTH